VTASKSTDVAWTSAAIYLIAEVSANHNQDFDQAVHIIEATKQTGVGAVNLQTR
jgi:sialic acid synthase SpsE